MHQAGHQAVLHHGLPPSVERDGGASAPAAEGCSACQAGRQRVAISPSRILLGLRSAPKEDSNTSSAELVYGVPLALPGELLSSPELPAVEFLQLLRQQPPQPLPTRPLTYSEAASAPSRQLLEATYVFVRRGAVSSPLAPQYDGPYLVKQRGQKVFQVEMGGRLEVVSVDRLKPYLGQPVDPALPPRRGRPPLSS